MYGEHTRNKKKVPYPQCEVKDIGLHFNCLFCQKSILYAKLALSQKVCFKSKFIQ